MYAQIEITTRCNFSCYYCAGRHMPQQDMAWDDFCEILGKLTEPSTVCLQGEGEPSLHPRFYDMAQRVREQGHRPYTILNGTRLDAQRLNVLFPTLAVSVDTLEPEVAERIGRYNLPKVMANLQELTQVINPKRITIMSVDFGQRLDDLKPWVKSQGFGRHIVQPLSRKDDYAKHYTVPIVQMPQGQQNAMQCHVLEAGQTRFLPSKAKSFLASL